MRSKGKDNWGASCRQRAARAAAKARWARFRARKTSQCLLATLVHALSLSRSAYAGKMGFKYRSPSLQTVFGIPIPSPERE